MLAEFESFDYQAQHTELVVNPSCMSGRVIPFKRGANDSCSRHVVPMYSFSVASEYLVPPSRALGSTLVAQTMQLKLRPSTSCSS